MLFGVVWIILGQTSFSNHPAWGYGIAIGGAIIVIVAAFFYKPQDSKS